MILYMKFIQEKNNRWCSIMSIAENYNYLKNYHSIFLTNTISQLSETINHKRFKPVIPKVIHMSVDAELSRTRDSPDVAVHIPLHEL